MFHELSLFCIIRCIWLVFILGVNRRTSRSQFVCDGWLLNKQPQRCHVGMTVSEGTGGNVFVPNDADTWIWKGTWSQLTGISLPRFWTSCALSAFATVWQSVPTSISSVTISCQEGICYCRHASWTTSAGRVRETESPGWWPDQGIHVLAL